MSSGTYLETPKRIHRAGYKVVVRVYHRLVGIFRVEPKQWMAYARHPPDLRRKYVIVSPLGPDPQQLQGKLTKVREVWTGIERSLNTKRGRARR